MPPLLFLQSDQTLMDRRGPVLLIDPWPFEFSTLILHPRLWTVTDIRQLAWPGDLADDPEDD